MAKDDKKKDVRIERFGWDTDQGLVVEGEPDYEEISLTETVEDRNRGERPQ